MSENRYFTAVFRVTEAFKTTNPFTENTPWGRAVCVSVGDATAENEILRESLEEIRDSSCYDCAGIAETAIEKADGYIREQMDLPARLRGQIEEAQRADAGSQTAEEGA